MSRRLGHQKRTPARQDRPFGQSKGYKMSYETSLAIAYDAYDRGPSIEDVHDAIDQFNTWAEDHQLEAELGFYNEDDDFSIEVVAIGESIVAVYTHLDDFRDYAEQLESIDAYEVAA